MRAGEIALDPEVVAIRMEKIRAWAIASHTMSRSMWIKDLPPESIAYHGARMLFALEVIDILDGKPPSSFGVAPTV